MSRFMVSASRTVFVDIELTHDEFVDYFDYRDSVVITREVDVDVEFHINDLMENITDDQLEEEARDRGIIQPERWDDIEDTIENQFDRDELDLLIKLFRDANVTDYDLEHKLLCARFG